MPAQVGGLPDSEVQGFTQGAAPRVGDRGPDEDYWEGELDSSNQRVAAAAAARVYGTREADYTDNLPQVRTNGRTGQQP